MATFTEDWTKTAAEAAQTAQEAFRRYVDDSSALARTYLRAWNAGAQASLRIAFLQQNALMQATRTVIDAGAQANREWMDQAMESTRVLQDATSRLVAAGFEMADSAMPGARN